MVRNGLVKSNVGKQLKILGSQESLLKQKFLCLLSECN